ncbi:MAG: BatA domain-containing protein [Planctomycetaceae bacterium]
MGISFLTPMLLGGAALVAVPVVLHLVMRRKPVPHDFPALRFLKERAVANRRRLQLSHLLLLLLRMAALALLALALARPVLRGAAWLADGEAPVAAAFVFDTAPRMLVRDGNRTRLEQAAAMARVLFEKLPPGSDVAVLDTRGGPAAFSPALAAAVARVDKLSAATTQQPLPAAVAAAGRLLEQSPKQRRELYVFTDCSQGAWDAAQTTDLAAAWPDTSLLVVDVSASRAENTAIDRIELPSDRVPAAAPLVLSAAVSRLGSDTKRTVAVELLQPDGHYARRAVKPVTCKSGGTTRVDFEIAGLEPGTRQGRVLIDGADDLTADDIRSFTVAVGSPDGVIVAAPAPADRTGMFLLQAVAPAGMVKAGKARFEAVLVAAEGLDAAPWNDAKGIVLVDPPPLAARTWEALAEWVRSGRGLVVWLGPRAGSAEAFNAAAARRLLGGRLVRVWRSPAGDNYLAPAALDHPALAAFRRVGDAVPWQDFPVSRHWEFEPEGTGDDDPGATVVAAYRNGLPAVLEHRVGEGTVMVVTTPVSQAADDPDAWNTIATGFEPWPFVMLANELLLHVLDTTTDRNIVAGTPAVVRCERRDLAAAFVRTPGGDEFPAAIDQERGLVTVTATQEPGNYAVRSGGDVGGAATGFSANLAASDTDFARLAPDALTALVGPRARLARTEAELVRDVNLERVGSELYGWIILLAALAMASDWIVANRFYAPRDEAGVATAAATFADAAASGGEVVPPLPGHSPTPPPVPPSIRRSSPPPVPPPATRSAPPPVPEAEA